MYEILTNKGNCLINHSKKFLSALIKFPFYVLVVVNKFFLLGEFTGLGRVVGAGAPHTTKPMVQLMKTTKIARGN